MKIITVREKRIDGELVGYFVNKNSYFQKNDCPCVEEWIDQGNTPETELTEEELLKQKQNEFRADRNILLSRIDIEINKAEDLEKDSKDLREYRKALRDATIKWVMPESIL